MAKEGQFQAPRVSSLSLGAAGSASAEQGLGPLSEPQLLPLSRGRVGPGGGTP